MSRDGVLARLAGGSIPTRRWLLLAAVVLAAACNHTPIGASPQTPVPSPTSASDVGRLFVEALGETRYVSAEGYLAPAVRSVTSDTSLKTAWDALAARYGKYKSVGGLTSVSRGPDTDVSVQATFAGGTVTIDVIVDPTLEVTRLDFPASGGGQGATASPLPPAASASP